MGREPTVAEYVRGMVSVFDEVKRILTPDGNLWLNLGDLYAGSKTGAHRPPEPGHTREDDGRVKTGKEGLHQRSATSLPDGNLVGVPWQVAFALQATGWILRQDIIYHKLNPMPESVNNRCTKAHEYIFHLTKSRKYWYDAEAIKEPVSGTTHPRGNGVNPKSKVSSEGCKQNESFSSAISGLVAHRNKRDVWSVPTQSFKNAHFATYPPDLIRPCIRAGCPPNGVVLDPFSGAGTTGLVALQEGRQYIGIELNSEYVQMSLDRLAPLVKAPALSNWVDKAPV